MKMPSHKVVRIVLAGTILLCLLPNISMWAQQSEQTPDSQAKMEETQDVIKPAPRDIKEAIGIYVFIGWMWISIFVLIYILTQKIKEIDRIHRLKYFSSDKD